MGKTDSEIERFARLYRSSEYARTADNASNPNDPRQSLETVALAMARLSGAVAASIDPPPATLPMFWSEPESGELEHATARSRVVMRMLLCLIRFYEAPTIVDSNRNRRRLMRGSARARSDWYSSRLQVEGRVPNWRMERETLLWHLASHNLTPREALSQLFAHRHGIAQWQAARLTYLRAAIYAQDRILSAARRRQVDLWGVHVSEAMEFSTAPEPVPVSYLLKEVAVYAKANRVGPALHQAQPWLTDACGGEYRECFLLGDDAEKMIACVRVFMAREYWPIVSGIYWAGLRQGRELADGTTTLQAHLETQIDGARTDDPQGELWTACQNGAISLLGRLNGTGPLVEIPPTELVAALLCDFQERVAVRNVGAGIFWSDAQVGRVDLWRTFPPVAELAGIAEAEMPRRTNEADSSPVVASPVGIDAKAQARLAERGIDERSIHETLSAASRVAPAGWPAWKIDHKSNWRDLPGGKTAAATIRKVFLDQVVRALPPVLRLSREQVQAIMACTEHFRDRSQRSPRPA